MAATIQGGARIRNARRPEFEGTLACTVRARGGAQRYLLSAGHVVSLFGYALPGDAIEARFDDGRWLKVGEFHRSVAYQEGEGLQQFDAGIAMVTWEAAVKDGVRGLGLPRGTSQFLYEDLGLRLHGAVSGEVRDARLLSPSEPVSVLCEDPQGGERFLLHYGRQILYGRRSGDAWSPATQAGDSGALVLNDDGYAIGLHHAVTRDNAPRKVSICTPIDRVLGALEVELIDAGGAAAAGGAGAAPAPADPLFSADEAGIRSFDLLGVSIRALLEPHNAFGGIPWQLTPDGLVADGRLARSVGRMVTVPRVWRDFGPHIVAAAKDRAYRVPVELIVATICTESGGQARALRIEPGWVDDATTPHRVSAGLMQTLVSTARAALGDPGIDRDSLFDPEVSIRAGTAYIAQQKTLTRLDPPLVACAYNAGGVYVNEGAANRWRLRQYPIGTGAHADRFVQWFNDCMAFLREQPGLLDADTPSFTRLLRPA